VYLKSPFVAQVFVHGDSLHSVLVAVVVPSEEQVKAWAKSTPGKEGVTTLAAAAGDADFLKAVLADITRVSKEAKLQVRGGDRRHAVKQACTVSATHAHVATAPPCYPHRPSTSAGLRDRQGCAPGAAALDARDHSHAHLQAQAQRRQGALCQAGARRWMWQL
jgi:hypothetical protein